QARQRAEPCILAHRVGKAAVAGPGQGAHLSFRRDLAEARPLGDVQAAVGAEAQGRPVERAKLRRLAFAVGQAPFAAYGAADPPLRRHLEALAELELPLLRALQVAPGVRGGGLPAGAEAELLLPVFRRIVARDPAAGLDFPDAGVAAVAAGEEVARRVL